MTPIQDLELRADFRRAQRSRENDRRQNDRRSLPGVATYVDRSTVSGYRRLQTPDGGVSFSRYFGNAVPPTQPELFLRGALGRPGVTNSRPAT